MCSATSFGPRALNLDKFLHEHQRMTASLEKGTEPREGVTFDQWFRLSAGDVVLLDEASMAGTLQLADLVTLAKDAGAVVRLLLGDPAQLSAIEAGGALRLLEAEVGAVHLDHLHRFNEPDEATATLALRRGDPIAIDF
jgi:ATP-dependent exoDNAse (exonuclease V) alpha subunit